MYLKREGVLFTSHKNTTTASRGGVLINSGILACPVRYMAVYKPEIIFQSGSRAKKERPFLIPLHSYLMNRTLMIQPFHLLL